MILEIAGILWACKMLSKPKKARKKKGMLNLFSKRSCSRKGAQSRVGKWNTPTGLHS